MKQILLNNLAVSDDSSPIVIAECGINHDGYFPLAKELMHAAKESGADVVKFQTHITDAEMVRDYYENLNAGGHVTESLAKIMDRVHLSYEQHIELKKYAKELGVVFLSTPFSIQAVDLLEKVGMEFYKVGSGEISNLPFIDYIAATKKPVIISTGTAKNLSEIAASINTIRKHHDEVIVLQCTSNYPTKYEEVNLKFMARIREEFNVHVGLSDHCKGVYAGIAAVGMGAKIIEKHFTISRMLPGIDQSSSLEPAEFKILVEGVKSAYLSLGTADKYLNDESSNVRNGFSESIVTISTIKAGEILAAQKNIWVKRPGTGIPSYELPHVSGKKAKKDLPKDHLLSAQDFE